VAAEPERSEAVAVAIPEVAPEAVDSVADEVAVAADAAGGIIK